MMLVRRLTVWLVRLSDCVIDCQSLGQSVSPISFVHAVPVRQLA